MSYAESALWSCCEKHNPKVCNCIACSVVFGSVYEIPVAYSLLTLVFLFVAIVVLENMCFCNDCPHLCIFILLL